MTKIEKVIHERFMEVKREKGPIAALEVVEKEIRTASQNLIRDVCMFEIMMIYLKWE